MTGDFLCRRTTLRRNRSPYVLALTGLSKNEPSAKSLLHTNIQRNVGTIRVDVVMTNARQLFITHRVCSPRNGLNDLAWRVSGDFETTSATADITSAELALLALGKPFEKLAKIRTKPPSCAAARSIVMVAE
jgi:hypothetical protein